MGGREVLPRAGPVPAGACFHSAVALAALRRARRPASVFSAMASRSGWIPCMGAYG
jgi:hypothetical protein